MAATARINECGHADRKHSARGMCKPCYIQWRTKQGINQAACAKWYRSEKGQKCFFKSNLRQNYGITPEQYASILAEQNGVCAVCGKTEMAAAPNGRVRKLAVDHNHHTGDVRGILCTKCNTLIGHSNEDVAVLMSAIRYLQKHKGAKNDSSRC